MHSGEVYFFSDSLITIQLEALELVHAYNQTRPKEQEKRNAIMQKLFAHAGEGLYIEPPFHANWGMFTSWGDYSYANFNLTLVDDGPITIGSHVMIAPNVTLVTTGHPVKPELRRKAAQYSLPVVIEDNVWLGAGVTVLPGVTIGENSVIGAGSVVTKDIPANSVAYGTPCTVARQIGAHDDAYYWHERMLADDIPTL
ncbi:MAG: sugar O-acetyltransferase [Bifidobacteriaceae bacterium]|nr:sugar O-acetyltransferase [Bifidobacteriaceae bacterium]MCI1915095.1 sugar O-acetyltransferase [Bifidobacteriaceae bacterium]